MLAGAGHWVKLLSLIISKAGYLPNETVALGKRCWLSVFDFCVIRCRFTEEIIGQFASRDERKYVEKLVLLSSTHKNNIDQ